MLRVVISTERGSSDLFIWLTPGPLMPGLSVPLSQRPCIQALNLMHLSLPNI